MRPTISARALNYPLIVRRYRTFDAARVVQLPSNGTLKLSIGTHPARARKASGEAAHLAPGMFAAFRAACSLTHLRYTTLPFVALP
jgi:hypothetical protein